MTGMKPLAVALTGIRSHWQPITFGIAHVLIFTLLFSTGIYGAERSSDADLYYNYSSLMLDGQLPYRDLAVEYPPVALVLFILPDLFAQDFSAYIKAFTVEALLFDLAGIVLIYLLARRLKLNTLTTLTVYTLCLLAIGPTVIEHYDIMPAVTVLASLYAFSRGWNKLTWALVAIGVLTKLYPAVVVPLLLIPQLRARQYRPVVSVAASFLVTTAAIVIPCLALSPHGFLDSFSYHAERGLQIESTYSSFILMGRSLGLTSLEVWHDYGSINIASPLADTLASLSPVIMALSLAIVYWLFYRRQADRQPVLNMMTSYWFISVLVFIISNKVLSPQFIVWLYPMIPLVTGYWRHLSWLVFIAVGLLTNYVFPGHYWELFLGLEPKVIGALFLRNMLLIALAILYVVFPRGLSRGRRREAEDTAGS